MAGMDGMGGGMGGNMVGMMNAANRTHTPPLEGHEYAQGGMMSHHAAALQYSQGMGGMQGMQGAMMQAHQMQAMQVRQSIYTIHFSAATHMCNET